jgi:signal transduction histidine kinase/ligand-binding sensor domain-containing protein
MWLLLFLTACNNYVYAQNRVSGFLLYENIQGLSSGKLPAICQSTDGFLWIASENGLIRFDGYRYKRIVEAENTITDNYVTDVATDSSGNVWIGGLTKGLSRYNIKSKKYKLYKSLWQAKPGEQRINRIVTLPDGQVWLATGGNGLACYTEVADSFMFYKPSLVKQPVTETIIDEYNVIDFVIDKQSPHIIWLVTPRRVFAFNTRTKVFSHVQVELAPGVTFSCIEYDNRKGLWLGTIAGGTFFYDIVTGRFNDHPIVINGQEVKGIHNADVSFINDSTLWWACEEFGLLEFDTKKNRFSFAGPAFRYDSTQKSNYSFFRITKSNDAGIFVSMAGGYLQYHPYYKRLNRLLPNGPLAQTAQASAVVFNNKQQQYIIVGTKNSPVQVLSAGLKPLAQYSFPARKEGSHIVAAAQNAQQNITLLAEDGALYKLPENGNTLLHAATIASNGFAKGLEAGNNGEWWILASNRIYKWNQNSVSDFTDSFLFDASIKIEPFIYSIKADSKGQVWLGTNEGLHIINSNTKRIVFKQLPANNNLIDKATIKNLVIDSKDNLWFSSDDGYLYRYNPAQNEISAPLKEKGFASTAINSLALLPNDDILIATTEGLCHFNTKNLSWEIFDKMDGLFQNNINNGLLTSSNGLVIVNNYYQYNAFHYTEMPVLHQNLTINIINIAINDVALPNLQLTTNMPLIELPYQKNTIQVEFAAMHWTYPKRTRYYYRLLHGSDSATWQYLAEPLVLLTALSPGKYVLELKATGAGENSNAVVKIPLSIKAPVWQRWWFVALCFLAVAGVIVLLYQFRIRQIRKTNEVRSIISRNLHDEIGSTLTSINILSNVSQQAMEKEPEQAKEMLRKISAQSKSIQQNMSDIVWAIRSDNDKIENLLVRMREYAAQTLEPLNILTTISINETLLQKALGLQARKELLLIYKEAVNNIARHSGATVTIITLQQYNNMLQLTIKDNGKWKGNGTSSGTGLGSMKQRAAAIGGQCIIDVTESGTALTVTLPVT